MSWKFGIQCTECNKITIPYRYADCICEKCGALLWTSGDDKRILKSGRRVSYKNRLFRKPLVRTDIYENNT